MDDLTDLPLSTLLARVAAPEPTPGAGPSAAWTCGLAAALVEMVSQIELRKEPADEATTRQRVERAARLRARVLELAGVDAVAYSAVLDVLRRRDEPGHPARLRAALSDAAGPPAEIAEAAAEITRLAADAAAAARGGAKGEAVTAAVLAEAAVRACRPMIELNLAGMPGDPRRERVERLAQDAAADLARAVRTTGSRG
jgi:formiminotetrahydrofolate cyclodeaminase